MLTIEKILEAVHASTKKKENHTLPYSVTATFNTFNFFTHTVTHTRTQEQDHVGCTLLS